MGTDYSIKRDGKKAEIFLFPKQQQFIQSECDEVFFGGAAGPGKSYALLMFCLQRRLKFPKTRGLLLRRKFPELERSLISESRKLYPMFGAKYNSQNHQWRFPNASIQEFGHMEHEHTVHDYQSAQYHDICFDEASHFSEFQIRYMFSRCRSAIPGVRALIRLASNPGGVSHGFLKRRYVEPYKKNKIWTEPETEHTCTFIPAKLRDNPALMENDPGYEKRLRGLPEKQRRALLDGDWEVFEGQFFNEWNENLHVLLKPHVPAPNTQKIISVDWGFAAPAAVYWTEITPMGRAYTYRELYVTLRSPKELANDIMDLTPAEEEGFRAVYLPPEVFGKKVELEDGGVPIAELMTEVLGKRFVVAKANNARIAGWTKMREYMGLAPDGLPWWQISPTCKNLIRTLPDMIYDETKVEDMETTGEDHPCVIGCTKLLTKKGIFDISSLVGTEGEVWTPQGWKRYFDCRKTQQNVGVVRLVLSNGDFVVATPDHRVLTSQGWKEIKHLCSSDLIEVASWKIPLLFQKQFKSLEVSGIIDAVLIFKEKVCVFTDWCGNLMVVNFLKDLMFTTLTTTVTTIGFQIWNVSIVKHTKNTICPQRKEKSNLEERLKGFDPLQKNGTDLRQDENGTPNTVKTPGKIENQFGGYVCFVKKYLKRLFQHAHVFAISTVKCLGIGDTILKSENISWSMIEDAGKEDVYNLEVEDVHCFSVNGGMVVHNCDSMRYGLMALNQVPKIMLTPHGTMDRIFGLAKHRELSSSIPMKGRGGYG